LRPRLPLPPKSFPVNRDGIDGGAVEKLKIADWGETRSLND
jgi:hypothetical protein